MSYPTSSYILPADTKYIYRNSNVLSTIVKEEILLLFKIHKRHRRKLHTLRGCERGIPDWKVTCLVFQGVSCGRERRPCRMWSQWKWWICLLQEHRLSWRESLAKKLVNVALFKLYMTYFSVLNNENRLHCKRPHLLLQIANANTKKKLHSVKALCFCCNALHLFLFYL